MAGTDSVTVNRNWVSTLLPVVIVIIGGIIHYYVADSQTNSAIKDMGDKYLELKIKQDKFEGQFYSKFNTYGAVKDSVMLMGRDMYYLRRDVDKLIDKK